MSELSPPNPYHDDPLTQLQKGAAFAAHQEPDSAIARVWADLRYALPDDVASDRATAHAVAQFAYGVTHRDVPRISALYSEYTGLDKTQTHRIAQDSWATLVRSDSPDDLMRAHKLATVSHNRLPEGDPFQQAWRQRRQLTARFVASLLGEHVAAPSYVPRPESHANILDLTHHVLRVNDTPADLGLEGLTEVVTNYAALGMRGLQRTSGSKRRIEVMQSMQKTVLEQPIEEPTKWELFTRLDDVRNEHTATRYAEEIPDTSDVDFWNESVPIPTDLIPPYSLDDIPRNWHRYEQ